jgi:signal transduction histidine kinase/ligand-binding sensor domain-containing protein
VSRPWCLIAAVVASTLGPARPSPAVELALAEMNQRMFTAHDGLPHATVTAIAQTPDHLLWLGTEAGLVRFDGVSFVAADAADRRIIRSKGIAALFVDRAGALWIGTNGGEGLIRMKDGRYESFHDALAALPRQEVRWNSVLAMHEDRSGTLWLGSWNGVLRLRDGHFEAIAEVDGQRVGPVSAFAEGADGSVWFGTWQGDVYRHRDGRFAHFGRADGLPGNAVRALAIDRDGALRVGTHGAGMRRVRDPSSVRFEDDGHEPHGGVTAAFVDRSGALWIGTEGGLGLARSTGVESLPGRGAIAVTAIAQDHEGNVWVASADGLLRLNRSRFQALPGGAAMQGIWSFHEDRAGALWIGTTIGKLFRWQGGVLTTFRERDGLCAVKVRSMLDDRDGRLWLGGLTESEGRLCRFEGGRFSDPVVLPPNPTPLRVVGALWQERDGTILAGADRLYRIAGHQAEPLPHPTIGFVTAMVEAPDGHLWIGGTNGLLERRGDGSWQAHGTRDGLPSDSVHGLQLADGTVWVATERGLGRVRDGRVSGFPSETGLLDDQIRAVVHDDASALWLCTPRGVFRVSVKAIDDFVAHRKASIAITPYGSDDGLPAYQCLAALRSRDGRIWFGTTAGPVSIDARSEAQSAAVAVAPLIERAEVDGATFAGGGAIAAPPGRGDLRIDYTVPSFRAPEGLRFRYRLEPFDRDWVEARDRRVAFYTNLPPRRYRFRVAADRGDGGAMAHEALLELTLAPHYYQTVPFRSAVGGLVLLAVFGLYRYRLRRLAAAHAAILDERTRIAREIHDTMAQGFTGITIQVATALDKLDSDPVQARENLRQAALLARTSLAETHRVVWDLRADASAAASVAEALRTIARRLDPGAAIEISASGDERRLPTLQESALLRIGQEALTNAVRHARAQHVRLSLEYRDSSVQLRISDDGVGFDAASLPRPSGHFGLQGMRERTEMLRGTMQLDSRPGAGTTLSIEIPVPRRS